VARLQLFYPFGHPMPCAYFKVRQKLSKIEKTGSALNDIKPFWAEMSPF
jgi:hypothetical protein